MSSSGRSKQRSTITDVATEAGVSVATVSRALRGLPNVSEPTRKRVHEAARKLSYTIDSRASSLASGRTGLVGLVAPLFGSWYTGQVVAGVESALAEAGLDLLVYSVDRPENRHAILLERVVTRRIDGLILVDFFVDPDRRDDLDGLNVPTVVIGEKVARWGSLSIDNVAGGRLAAEHLLALGHRSIAYMGGQQRDNYRSPVTNDRRAGAAQAWSDAGLDPTEIRNIDGGYTVDGGAAAFDDLRAMDPMPTAVFSASDEMAVGLLAAARAAGVRVPEDLSIVGFDDHDVSAPLGLSTIRQSPQTAGAQAVELLAGALDVDASAPHADSQAAVHIEMPLELVVRSSTGVPSAT